MSDQPRLVVFDLETMSLRPQYTDVAGVLVSLAVQTNRSEQDLFRTYLTAIDVRTGRTTDQREAWDSMRTVRVMRTFEALPWVMTMTGTPGVEAPERAVSRLSRDINDLDLLA